MPFQRHRSIVKAPKRQTIWLGVDIALSAVAGNATILLASLNAAALAVRPFTVVRTHLLIHWESDQEAASESPSGAYGMVVTSEQASTATTIPGPISEIDSSGFFVWSPLFANFLIGDATGFISPRGYTVLVDSKAMRKVGPNEQIRMRVENTTAVGAFVTMLGRMLVKLQ